MADITLGQHHRPADRGQRRQFGRHVMLAVATAMLLSACATDGEEEGASSGRIDLTDTPLEDPRVTEEVNRICFSRSISGFTDWDAGEGLILRRGVSQEYLVTFIGVCTPLDRANRIGITNDFAGGCLDRGSNLIISSELIGRGTIPFETDRCRISRIYEFNRDAQAPEIIDEG